MVEDRSLCFSTSKREHCISFLVPCSILHCPLPPPQPPSTGLTFPRDQLRGQRSTNISSILHFHYRSPIPQGTNRGGRSVPCWRSSIGVNQPFLLPSRILVSCSVTCVPGKLSIPLLRLHGSRYIIVNVLWSPPGVEVRVDEANVFFLHLWDESTWLSNKVGLYR